MRLSMALNYSAGFKETVEKVVELEKAGLDLVWVAEAYTFDAISQVGYLAARTDRLEIGTGIVNVYSRTPTLIGMTAAGCDYVSDGRFVLGLGASGPQVVEGFHGIPYQKPMHADRGDHRRGAPGAPPRGDRRARRDGAHPAPGRPGHRARQAAQADQPAGALGGADLVGEPHGQERRGHGAGRPTGGSRSCTTPSGAARCGVRSWRPGRQRVAELAPLEISAGGMLAIDDKLTGEAQQKVLDFARPMIALYVGGMGARGKNFYNDLAVRYGYAKEAAEIQDLYLDGKKEEAAAQVPADWVLNSNLVGSPGFVKERVAAYKESGVTMLQVNPVGPDAVRQIEQLRALVDA